MNKRTPLINQLRRLAWLWNESDATIHQPLRALMIKERSIRQQGQGLRLIHRWLAA